MERPDIDRRRYPRVPTDLDALAATPEGVVGDCSILDINIYGCRLEIDAEPPDDFFVVDLASNVAYKARVAWRKAPLIGVRFMETWLLSAEGAPEWLAAIRATRLAKATPGARPPLPRPEARF
jgi:hypothetical protein